ncbi:hypothetical protein GT030_18445 [Streptomyces sp. SID1328]|uniref:DUF6082 family protein n=1 Tax=Streptomyces sp. SID1328 TaxID=2690250 RepID=UPI0013687B37|nr:hypothetical protein [Streptomyces sp. SID1328]
MTTESGTAQRTTWVRAALAYGLLGLVLLSLILSTPFVLAALAPASADWGKLSDISQAYGAVSVVLSAIALAGVALSLLYQVRQTRTSNEQAIRDSHFQLATLALSDPDLLLAWSPPIEPVPLKRHRQHLVTSLALGELLQRFRIGHLSVEKLAVKLDGHFRGKIAREQWEREGPGWRRTMEAGDRRDRVFVRLVDERYRAAVAAGPASALLEFQDRPDRPQSLRSQGSRAVND